MGSNVYRPSELDSELAIYGGAGAQSHHDPVPINYHPRTVAAVSVDDDEIYHPSVPAGFEESAANVKNDDLAELSRFWICLGIPPAERDNAYIRVLEDTRLLNKYLDRLATLYFFQQQYKDLFAKREKCKANIMLSLSSTQGSRHDLTVLLLSLRNLTLRLFTLVNAARTTCQKPILFPSMKLAPDKSFTPEDDWVAYIKDEMFITRDVMELVLIILKFFPSMTPSTINEKVSAFFSEALSNGRVLFGKHLLGSASSGYKDGQDMAMTSSKVKPSSNDALCEVLGYSRPLTPADISLHLILGLNFETMFTDSDLPKKWLKQLEKRSGGSIVNVFQYSNDTAEPQTLSPETVWDMVKCEGIVRDNFVMIASKQEKKGQRTVVVPISGENTWKIPESYNLTSAVTPMFHEVQTRSAPESERAPKEQREQHVPNSERSIKSTRSTRSDVEVSALNPNIRTPHDSSIFIDAMEDNRGCYAARITASPGTSTKKRSQVPPNVLSRPSDNKNSYESSEANIYSQQRNGDQEVIFINMTEQRPESQRSTTNESMHSRPAYAVKVPDNTEWTPVQGPRKAEKSEKVEEQKYTVYDPNVENKETYETVGKDNFPKRRNSKIFMQSLSGSGLEEVGSGTPKMKRRGSKVFMDRMDSNSSLQDEMSAPPGAKMAKMKIRGSKVALSNIDDESPSKVVKRRGSKVFGSKESFSGSNKPSRRNSKITLDDSKSKESTPKFKNSKLTESDLRAPQPIENYIIERATDEELMERARVVANDPVSYLGEPSNISTTCANDPVFVLCDPSAFSHENTDPGIKLVPDSSAQDHSVQITTVQEGSQHAGTKAYTNVQKNRVATRPVNPSGERTVVMTDDIFRADYSEVSANTSMAQGPEHPSDAGIVFLASLTK